MHCTGPSARLLGVVLIAGHLAARLLREPIYLQAVGQMARVTHRDHMTAVDLVDLEA